MDSDELDDAVFGQPSPPPPFVAPCIVCGGRTELCCSGCNAVHYCSPTCQQHDWQVHKRVCTQQVTPSVHVHSLTSVPPLPPPLPPPPTQPPFLACTSPIAGVAGRNRLKMRAAALLAFQEGRHKDSLDAAVGACELALGADASSVGANEDSLSGNALKNDANTLVEMLLIVRCAFITEDFALGLSFLETLTTMVDHVTGVGRPMPLFQSCAAATLLCVTAELCALYSHEERSIAYGHAYLSMVRLAHGEGSPAVGDAHGFLTGLFVRHARFEAAVQHAGALLKIRQRCAGGNVEKSVADAHWNVGVIRYQLAQKQTALESFQTAREIYTRLYGEGLATSVIDIATSTLYHTLGEHQKASLALRQAVRSRQRTLGFAHVETRHAWKLLAVAEAKANDDVDGIGNAGGDAFVIHGSNKVKYSDDNVSKQDLAAMALPPMHSVEPASRIDSFASETAGGYNHPTSADDATDSEEVGGHDNVHQNPSQPNMVAAMLPSGHHQSGRSRTSISATTLAAAPVPMMRRMSRGGKVVRR